MGSYDENFILRSGQKEGGENVLICVQYTNACKLILNI
jgi:hypothetical protein